MIQLKTPIPDLLVDELECHFCENGSDNWIIESIPGGRDFQLHGYFVAPELAQSAYQHLSSSIRGLPASPTISELPDQDWQEAYKLHFHPWNCGTIHWVPAWLKESYQLPPGHQALYLDPGMAFGTGNHETTRLCLEGLVQYHCKLPPEEVPQKTVVDAGCGSGILALSAALLGFHNIQAFDIDEDSIRICHENASLNGLDEKVRFAHAGLDDCLHPGAADLILANILAPVLIENAGLLLQALSKKSGSTLLLSGILNQEAKKVSDSYMVMAKSAGKHLAILRQDSGIWTALVCQIK
jgi:ribosomal protein L11 methyltransferase